MLWRTSVNHNLCRIFFGNFRGAFPDNIRNQSILKYTCFYRSTLGSLISVTTAYFFKNLLFFYKKSFFLTQPQCCLIFSIKLQMLRRCGLMDIGIVILRKVLYVLYLCWCLELGAFMSYLCDLCDSIWITYLCDFSFSSSFALWLIV